MGWDYRGGLLLPPCDFTRPMREDVKQKYFSTSLRERPRSVLASRPFFLLVERVFVLTPGAHTKYNRDRDRSCWSALSGLMRRPDPIQCEAAKANRWLKCQPSSYVRLKAYGFFGLSEGA